MVSAKYANPSQSRDYLKSPFLPKLEPMHRIQTPDAHVVGAVKFSYVLQNISRLSILNLA